MSKKRTAAEASNEHQTTDGSDSVLQQGNANKRAKLDLLSDTTLQDLPIELLECILVKVITMEVKGTKLAKCTWKEKADLVISRLRTVCSQWSNILGTQFFRNELHRAIDGTAQQTIRLEILHQSSVQWNVYKVTTLKDDIFAICKQDNQTIIKVYDRNSMAEVNDIPIPEKYPVDIAACKVSNCVYVIAVNTGWNCPSILRITKDEEHQFNISPWISDLNIPFSTMSVSPNASLVIHSVHDGKKPAALSIYDTHGILQHKIMLTQVKPVVGLNFGGSVIHKSNGKFILISINDQFETELTEIDTDGNIERQTKPSVSAGVGVNFADIYGRIVIADPHNNIQLFDSEFNLMDFTGPPLNGSQFTIPHILHYNSERNELVGIHLNNFVSSDLTIFRFTEE